MNGFNVNNRNDARNSFDYFDREEVFVPGIVFGIIAGFCALFYWVRLMRTMYVMGVKGYPNLPLFVLVFIFQVALSAISLWMGVLEKRAIENRLPFYVLFVLALSTAMALFVVADDSFNMLMSCHWEFFMLLSEKWFLLAFFAVFFTALATLSCALQKRLECRLTALIAVVLLCIYLIPRAWAYTDLFTSHDVTSFIFDRLTRMPEASDGFVGIIAGTCTLFSYASRYISGVTQIENDEVTGYRDLTINQPQVEDTSKKRFVIAIAVSTIMIIAVFIGLIVNGYSKGKVRDQESNELNKHYTTDVPTPTVLVSEESENEINFSTRDITVRFIGIGTDSEGKPCVVADVINDSNSLVEVFVTTDSAINGYLAKIRCSVDIQPNETLRVKMKIDPAFVKSARINADNVTTVHIPMMIAYGKWFRGLESVDDMEPIKFDSPAPYDSDKEEAVTKNNGKLCYSDKNIDIYYQGVVETSYTSRSMYAVFFVDVKNPAVKSIETGEILSPSEVDRFAGWTRFGTRFGDPATPEYLCVQLSVSGEFPKSYTHNFEYSLYDSKGKEQTKEISLTMDLTKRVVEEDNESAQ